MKAPSPGRTLEARIARLLMVGTYSAVALIAIGVLVMVFTGRSPLDIAPSFEPGRLVGDLVALQPAGFLWLGVLVVLATPLTRVVAALAGFIRVGEREMAFVAGAIVAVILIGVIVGIVTPQARG